MRQRILMCAPEFFGVDYVINPWMDGHVGMSDHAIATQQWTILHTLLTHYADIERVPPQPRLPDIVFTANAGLVWDGQVIVSRFHAPERQGETPHYADWFRANGFKLADWPDDVPFEGAGDALFERDGQPRLWLGHGFRSAPAARALLQALLDCEVAPLRLINPSFYHLDTCFCPLSEGRVIYYPGAFDVASRTTIETAFAPENRLAVGEDDARAFVCNAVELSGHLFLNAASDDLQQKLKAWGFTPVITPLTEFMKAGGSAKCLTLKLNDGVKPA